MADKYQFVRGTKAKNDAYVGPDGSISVDRENDELRLHDGATAGGTAVQKKVVTTATGTQTVVQALDQRGPVFDSVADMKAATGLTVGIKCRTLGYYEPGDGGGNDYEIVADATGTDDGGSFIDLSGSGLQAKGLFSQLKAINIRQFGAKLDRSDENLIAQNAIDYLKQIDGGELWLDHHLGVSQGLVVDASNIVIRGYGKKSGYRNPFYTKGIEQSQILWVGPEDLSATMIKFTSDPDNTGNKDKITGVGITGVLLNGDQLCGNGVVFESVGDSIYDCDTAYFRDVHFESTTLSNGLAYEPTDNQNFDWSIRCSETNAALFANTLVVLNGAPGSGGNTSVGRIRQLRLNAETSAVALECGSVDTVQFDFVTATTRLSAQGDGGKIILHAEDTMTVRPSEGRCRAVTFNFLQANRGVIAKAAIDPEKRSSQSNMCLCLSMDNSTTVPTVESGANFTYWQNRLSNGTHKQRLVSTTIDNAPIGSDGKSTGDFTSLTADSYRGAGVQQDPTDVLGSPVLRMFSNGNGPFGLGNNANAPALSDVDDPSQRAGFYRAAGGSGVFPQGALKFGIILVQRYDGGSIHQFYHSEGVMYQRRYSSGSWSQWERIIAIPDDESIFSGTFTAESGETVTVLNGVITSVA